MKLCEITIFVIPCQNLSYLWVGILVGSVAAMVGAVIEYRRAEQRTEPQYPLQETRLPGCMVLMAGALGGMGIISLIASALAGSPLPALIMGLGVGAGFFGVFFVLVIGWVLLGRVQERRRKKKENPHPHQKE